MDLIITGGTGFIGSHFLNDFKSKYNNIYLLSRDYKDNQNNTSNINHLPWQLDKAIPEIDVDDETVFIHLAYDNVNLKNNILGLKNILDFIHKKKINRFIYLSSFVVYDLNSEQNLNENSNISKLSDPYTHVKKQCELLIENYYKTNKNSSIFILQPTIVYGFNGNWSYHGLKESRANKIIIPKGKLSSIYVKDLSRAIYLASNSYVKNGLYKLIISSDEKLTWRDFYLFYIKVQSLDKEDKIVITDFKNKFHDNSLVNLLYQVSYSKFGLKILISLMPLLRKLKPLSKENYKNIQERSFDYDFKPIGVNRIVHSHQGDVDVSRASEILNFKSNYKLFDLLETEKSYFNEK